MRVETKNEVSVLVGGDCGPSRGPDQGVPVDHHITLIRSTLAAADIRFVNCMRTYTDRKITDTKAPQVAQPALMADLYSQAGFDGVTMANNHTYDCGPDAMLDTVALFRARGIQVTGAGRDLDEARQPVIVERNGIRVAYLGYTSVGAEGSDAGQGKPGVTNIPIHTTYETRGAHAPVRIRTEPDGDALARLVDDVRRIRPEVDALILAFHGGVIRLPRVISDYQRIVAHAAIEAGADAVVGHAPHLPKGVEMYKGKPIFYSLGVFAMTKPNAAAGWAEPAWAHGAIRNHADLDPAYPDMPYGEGSTLSLLAKLAVGKGGVARVSFLPMKIDTQYRPQVLAADDARFSEVLEYLEWASVDLPHRFKVQGNEVLVESQD
ncbi:CapA family protein [Bordetella sp. N]|uniref:CapA family protein n=1 Tax=Bordetella sp. N TaxID=1746199 RepID=UPI00070EDC6F|nr:CapA family protein [Bordetella sp. N]ALM84246.1 hypothetical protein ASB57_15830 [Bordetella sp. N]